MPALEPCHNRKCVENQYASEKPAWQYTDKITPIKESPIPNVKILRAGLRPDG